MLTFDDLDPELEALDLQNQELGKKGAQRRSGHLPEFPDLHFEEPLEMGVEMTAVDLRFVVWFNEVEVVQWFKYVCMMFAKACANIGDAGCAFIAGALQRNSSLQSVNLRNNHIGEEGVESITEGLALSWKETGAGIQLKELNLGHNLFGDAGLHAISKVVALGFLQLLDLSNLKMVTSDGWQTFCSTLVGCRLTTLNLRQNDQLPEAAALALALALKTDVGALQELDLSLCSVSAKAAPQLLQLPLRQLQLLGSEQMDVQELGSALAGSTLEMLDLCNCQLGPAAAATLADVLLPAAAGPRNPLTMLHLDRNLLGFDGAVALSRGLRGWPAPGCRLQVLTLRENRLGDGGVGAIAEALEDNVALKELDLSSNEVGDLGGQSMGLLLQKDPRLASLSLKSNHISDAGAEALAQGLEKNSWLEELDLSENHIKMAGVGKLCAALEHNGTLETLVLEGNEVKSDILDSVEQLATDVMVRRERLERQPPKIAVTIEEPESPVASDSEAGQVLKCGGNPKTYKN
ncbi:unnamed protein product [Cladocopium goreaui]|uniref:Nucleotide-binding oligomerization domain-containing protein 2 (Caspase recruitment domain-containing protein 15) n=1 Tax=Cladocopium goreaui TaxID=2562237 RepID=A0A9P1BQA1_9DINO|nr:unnamed protein product [Cladocopium goreaui]